MRRAPIVITATVAGVAAVLGFEPRAPTTPAVTAQPQSTAARSSTANGTRTATGDAIDTRYGAAQVRVTLTDGKITAIEAVQLQSADPKSAQISSSAEPVLREEALTKQSADIDAVSGATITSASYEASLQSALDKLGFEAPDGSRGSSEIPDVVDEHGGPGF